MALSLEHEMLRLISTRCLRHRIDLADTTHQITGTATSGTTSGLADTAKSFSANDFQGGYICVTNPGGPNYDIARQITSNTGSSTYNFVLGESYGGFTGDTWPQAPTTSSKYRAVVGTAIATSDKMTTVGLMDVQALHNKLQTVRFPGGLLRGFITTEQERDLMDDTSWLNSAIYDTNRLGNYGIARWAGVELMIGSEVFRESVAGVAYDGSTAAYGLVHVAPIFGADSYSILHWGNGTGDFGVEFLYKQGADSGDLLNAFSTIGWKALWAGEVLRATSVIGLMTGATGIDLLV
jgi:hypothetical protein